jgi:putative phosphoesterase
MKVGVLSDTHGLLRPEAREAMRGCGLILHAGDVGDEDVLMELRKIAPVVAVRGNVDSGPWAGRLPATEVAECEGKSLYLLHRLADLDLSPRAACFDAVIYGHSHRPAIEWRKEVLFFNPGSAGPRRFSLPVTVGRIEIVAGELRPAIIPIL